MSRHFNISGLGLVASGRRTIKPGTEWNALYDRSALVGDNPIIADGDTYTTLDKMADIVSKTLADTRRVAPRLKGSNLDSTLRNIWNHVYNHFQYEPDQDGVEQIRRPSRSWIDRKAGIDCDCMSVVIGSILTNLSIDFSFRKATYDAYRGWQHVYVVVPRFKGANLDKRSEYYVLDCVVDRFDYEVPYIKKFDKVMKIQYLNGVDFSALQGGVTPTLAAANGEGFLGLFGGLGEEFVGLHGLDATPQEVGQLFMLMLKEHLVNTRKIVGLNPGLIAGLYDPATFVQRLDLLLAAFDDPKRRNAVLDDLAKAEERTSLNGLDGGQLGSFFKKVADKVKSVATTVVNTAQKVANKTGEALKTAGQAVVTAVKAVGKFIVKYNPATVAIRNGVLIAMKLNLFRLAEKLGYGLWTEEQAAAKGLNVEEWRKAKSTLDKVRKIHKGLGGKIDKLDNAIKKGWEKGVAKHNLVHGIDGVATKRKTLQQIRNKTATKSQQNPAAVQQVTARVQAATPLLQAVSDQLAPVAFQTLLRKQEASDLDSFYQAVRTNKGGIATKLSLAYKPTSEASTYNKAEYNKLLARVRAAENLVLKQGGTTEQLRDAINAGKQVAIAQGVGEAATASTAAASSVLAVIGTLLKQVDFSKMFQGKASSPNADASEFTQNYTAELDDDTFDEGDPNAQVIPMESLLTTTMQSVQNNVVDAAANKINNTLLPAQTKVPVNTTVATKPQQPATNPQQNMTADDTTPVIDYQEAQVVSSKVNAPTKEKDNTMKYVLLGGGALAGVYLLSKAFAQPPQVVAAPTPVPTPVPVPVPTAAPPATPPAPAPASNLSGVKGKKNKSQKTRKKVMTITIK